MNFVALDVETANHNRDSICSIGLIKVKNNEIVDSYYTLINPKQEFNWHFTQIHNITYQDVVNEPTFDQIADDLFNFWSDVDFLVAHNAPFDMSVLVKSFQRFNIQFKNIPYVCSLALSKQLYDLESHRLNIMADYFNINLEHHHALSDAMVCAKILIEICSDNQKSIEEMIEFLHYDYGLLGERGFKLNKPKHKRNKVNKKGARASEQDLKNDMKKYAQRMLGCQAELNQLNKQIPTVQMKDRIKLQMQILNKKKEIDEIRLNLEKIHNQLKRFT